MAATNLRLKKDVADGTNWQRRQSFENERKKRIFDGKERLLGLNIPKLERQRADKELGRAKYQELDMRYNQQTKNIQNAMHAQRTLVQERALSNEATQSYYRCRFQGKATRREWDLSDPKNYKHGIDYDSLGSSSAQIYEGYDAGREQRKVEQREQLRSWLDQQMEEGVTAEKERKERSTAYYELAQRRDKVLADMATIRRETRQAKVAEIQNCNIRMAEERRWKREREKIENREADKAEIENTLNSDLLTEDRNMGRCTKDPISSRGMTEAELAVLRQAQKNQFQSLCMRKIEESMMHKQWEQFFYNMDRELCLKDRHLNNLAQRKRDYYMLFNKKMIDESHERSKNMYNDKQPFDMEPFYNWFNRTSR